MYNTDMPSRAELPTSQQLVRSTLIAIGTAAAILVTIVLPAEYAIDPTGTGRVLGLTEMGEIKSQLSEEAEADRERDRRQQQVPARPDQRSGLMDLLIRPAAAHSTGHGGHEHAAAPAAAPTPGMRSDQMKVTLKPNEGNEIKLRMTKGATADFAWDATGPVNYDMHGEGGGKSHSYKKGRGSAAEKGVIEAAFDGDHGWFWRNRGKGDVTVTLTVTGAYADIRRVE